MTIQTQIDAAAAGSIVTIVAGTYAEAVTIGKAITLRASGVVLIRPPANTWNAISVTANNVTIEGFDIANAQGDGIEANNVHHLTVRNCRVSGCGESGIQANYCDWVTVETNECTGNGYKGWFSGVSVYQCRNLAAGTGTRNIIRGNRCYNNVTLSGPHTDGNGIIIDDFQSTQTAGFPNYTFPTLVENNLCYGNGGKGIQVTWSDNVTLRRNTCVANNVDPLNDGTWRGDISISQSKGAVVDGNIAVCQRGAGMLANNRAYDNTGTTNGFNNTVWSGNFGWDPAGTPSTRQDGQSAPTGITWANPNLVAYQPTLAGAANAGWRGVPPAPPAPPPPLPDELSPFSSQTPAQIVTESQAYELGTRINIDVAGRITGLRLYRTNASATQTVRLWKNSAVIASAPIAGGPAGWVEAVVDVPAAAGDVFLVSYGKSSPQSFALTNSALAAPVVGDGFTIPADGGPYAMTLGTLPTLTNLSRFYWVDVRFAATVTQQEPTNMELAALIAALQTTMTNIETRLAALEARPVPADVSAQIVAMQASIAALQSFDQQVKDL